MNAQEKLEAMFCPRLDSALVASIYNDCGDFASCIPILSALAKAAVGDDDDDDDNSDNDTRETCFHPTTTTTQPVSKNNQTTTKGSKAAGSAKKAKRNNHTSVSTIANHSNKTSHKADTVDPSPSDIADGHDPMSHHPLKEKILLWTESVAASRSELTTPASKASNFKAASAASSSSMPSSSSSVQYLPSPTPVQPLTAPPTGFKGFKQSETQAITRSTLGSTLPSSNVSSSSAAATAAATAPPPARLKAVRNPNFNREVVPLDEVESLSSDQEDEEEEEEEEQDETERTGRQPNDTQSVSNSDLASVSTTSASTPKKKNRRSGRGKKDRKKREALRAQAEAEAATAAVFSQPPLTLKSWKKDRGGSGGRREPSPEEQADELAALLDSATLLDSAARSSTVQMHRERRQREEDQEEEGGGSNGGSNSSSRSTTSQSGTNTAEELDSKRREQVAFLQSCFPDKDHSDEYLTKCLQESRWDIESAVELILSRMFLEDEQVETASSGSNLSGQSQTTTESSWTTLSSGATVDSKNDAVLMHGRRPGQQGGNGQRKDKNKGAQRVWQDHPGKRGGDALTSALAGQDELLYLQQPGGGNDWTAFEHQIQILLNTFHTMPRKTIVATFHAQGANMVRTIEALEAKQRQSMAQWRQQPGRYREAIEASQQFDTKLAQLTEMFPNHAVAGLKKFLVYSQGNVHEAMNAVLAAGFADEDLRPSPLEASSSSASSSSQPFTWATEYVPLPVEIRYKNDRTGTPVAPSLLTEAGGGGGWTKSSLGQLPSTSNPYPQGVRAFANTLLEHSNAELYNDEDDPIWCRQQAHDALEQRNELFRKAAKAYQHGKGKGIGVGGIAAYYADEGKKFDVMGKKWHMRAARAVVQQHRLENNDPNLVDLHGLTISEAQTVVREAVTEWFARSTMQANRIAARPLRIVTGVGSHSKDRIARLYPSILSMLQKDGWRIETESGVILVKGVARLVTTNRK